MVHRNSMFSGIKKKFPKTLVKDINLAHHPTCEKYDNHIIRIFGRALCIGCTFFYTGFIISTIIFFSTANIFIRNWNISMIIWAIGFVLFSLFLVQLQIKEIKILKIILRFCLGFGSSLMIFSILVKIPFNWIGIVVRIIAVVFYYFLYKLFFKLRKRKTDNYCIDCPKGKYPFCKHNLQRISETIKEMQNKNQQNLILYDLLCKTKKQFENGDKELIVEFIVIKDD